MEKKRLTTRPSRPSPVQWKELSPAMQEHYRGRGDSPDKYPGEIVLYRPDGSGIQFPYLLADVFSVEVKKPRSG